jgi:hypothetical protein
MQTVRLVVSLSLFDDKPQPVAERLGINALLRRRTAIRRQST